MSASLEQRGQWLLLIVLLGGLIWLLASALTPFVVAAAFAYLFDPLADRLERIGLQRSKAVGLIFLVLTLSLLLSLLWLVPFLEHQTVMLIRRVPDAIGWLHNDAVPWLNARFGLALETPDVQQIATVVQQHWKEAGSLAATVLGKISKSGMALLTAVVHVLVVPIAFFYLLRDWDTMIGRIAELLPRSVAPAVSRLAREADATLSGFVRGQLAVMLVLGVVYAIALWAIGLDIGPLIGIVAGLISFVPYVGGISGVVMGLIAAVVQYHDTLHPLLVLAVFGIGHLLEAYFLVPRLVGGKIGLHPLAVIFAVLVGGELFGFLGVLLALPAASVAMVLLRYLHQRYRASDLYTQPPQA
jgi:predicted PurR-regulated permease PerM